MRGLLLAALLSGRPAAALGLEEARDAATRQALAVERARAQAAAAADRAWVATAENLPAVVGFASANTGAGFTAFGFPRPVQTQLGAGLRGTWALLSPADWGAARAARQTAVGQAALLDWAILEARRSATTAFFAAAAARDVEAALARGVADAQAAADAVAELAEAGLRPQADAARARADAAAARADLATARGERVARCAELLALLRRDDPTCDLDPAEAGPPLEGPAAHPALQSARAALAAAQGGRLAAVGGLAPRLDASGTAAWYTTNEASGGPGWSAGLDLTVPLVASGAGARGAQAAEAEVAIARLGLEEQERALRVALASAEARLEAAHAGRTARAEARAAAEAALRLTAERYDNGLASLTDWMDARRARDAAAVALARAHAEAGAALAEVEAARGVGR